MRSKTLMIIPAALLVVAVPQVASAAPPVGGFVPATLAETLSPVENVHYYGRGYGRGYYGGYGRGYYGGYGRGYYGGYGRGYNGYYGGHGYYGGYGRGYYGGYGRGYYGRGYY